MEMVATFRMPEPTTSHQLRAIPLRPCVMRKVVISR